MTDPDTAPSDFADMTLDELRIALAPDIAASAIFDGWNETALIAAAEMAGADPDVARLAFPQKPMNGQAMDMIEAWIESVDQAMEREWPPERLADLKIRERIRELVAFRLGEVEHIDEAVRRAMSIMALAASVPRYAATPPASLSAVVPVPQPISSTRSSGDSRAAVSASVVSQLSGARTGRAA